jgi:integrase
MQAKRSATSGIRARHSRTCGTGERCTCKPTWEASVWSRKDHRKLRKTFPTLAAAREWQRGTAVAVHRGELRAPTRTTLQEAAERWLEGAAAGTIRNRSGEPYKPSVTRSYGQSLRKHVLPELGSVRLAAIHGCDLQDLVDQLVASGLSPSTVRNALLPVRAIFRRALRRQEVGLNPTRGLDLPPVRGRRDPICSPALVERLLAALPPGDRALWAMAFYAGPRAGELLALRYEDVDLTAGIIGITRSWDRVAGVITPKSRAGVRSIPMVAPLRRMLIEHRLHTGRSEGLVFGRSAVTPFYPGTINDRARRRWLAAGLTPVTLHEGRHIAASLWIDAGIALTSVSRFLGHSSISITVDTYGHLVTGAEDRAAEQFDRYLDGMTATNDPT